MSERNPRIEHFYDPVTGTFTWVVDDGRKAVVIDPVMDYDPSSGRLTYGSCERVIAHLDAHELELAWILETHAHADHLSGCRYLQDARGGRTGAGEGICEVQKSFAPIFNLGSEFATDGSQVDQLFIDGEALHVGALQVNVMNTPGHTPDSVTYVVGEAAFVGDTLFRPDLGTARCDFPGGSARVMYDSIQKIYQLPDATSLHLCHDYPAEGDAPVATVPLPTMKATNVHIGTDTPRREFVEVREARDATLAVPALLIPSLQVNIRGGALPPAEPDGNVYLKTPVNLL